MLLVCRFDVPAAEAPQLRARARTALELLGAQPGCRGGELGRSVDAYRRALSPFPVREHVVPLLSQARTDGPAAFEVLLSAAGGSVAEHESLLAE